MMDDEPKPRAFSDTRQALTVALVKPYTRVVIGEETLSITRVFNFCHPPIFCTATKIVHFPVLLLEHYREVSVPLGAPYG